MIDLFSIKHKLCTNGSVSETPVIPGCWVGTTKLNVEKADGFKSVRGMR